MRSQEPVFREKKLITLFEVLAWHSLVNRDRKSVVITSKSVSTVIKRLHRCKQKAALNRDFGAC